jgi:phosphoglycerol transferase
MSVAVLSSLAFVVGFGGGIGRLSAPLGVGDVLPVYYVGKLWGNGSPFGDTTLGFPLGLDLRYFPTADVTQNLMAGLFNSVTHNPFLSMNLVFAASFPLAALAALWVLRIVDLRGPLAVFLSLAFTAVPFHWLRVEHVCLATMYAAVLGVGLALLVGTGRLEERLRARPRWRAWLPLAAIVVVIGASGVYYSCFAILLCSVAALYRFARGSRWRGVAVDLGAAASIAVVMGLVLLPSVLQLHDSPPLHPVADRLLIESVLYSGTLAFAILPAPVSYLPGVDRLNGWITSTYGEVLPYNYSAGVLSYSDGGSFFTFTALLFVAVGLVVLRRRSALAKRAAADLDAPPPTRARFGLVGLLLGAAILFYIPWGFNFLFAAGITTQLRAWDRMLPVIFLLVFVAAAVVWRDLRLPLAGRRVWAGFAICLVLLGLDGVLPYRSGFAAAFARGTAMTDVGESYGDAVNAALPEECGILTLPYVAYPESGPVVGMGVYEPFWLALTNPDKRWSFAAMKDTVDAAWQESLGNDIDAEAVAALEAGGFCAVHVDRRGYTTEDAGQMVGNLTSLLGTPVVTGFEGQWLTFALPDDDVADLDVADVDSLPDPLQVFYYPPDIERAGTLPEVDAFDRWWWIDAVAADFTVTSIVDDADFTTVSGELVAAQCGDQEVVATLTSGSQTATTTVRLGQGESRAFALKLDQPTDTAVLTVTTDGPTCTDDESTPPRSVALYNPTAAY